jgi:UDP-N-acetylmuramate dehydrogenase
MAELTTFKIGGPVDALVTPESREELARAVEFLEANSVPWMVLGLGSNLLVKDGGIRGAVVQLGQAFSSLEMLPGHQAVAGAAISLTDLSKMLGAAGLSGMEFAVGIPGSLGGAVFMNAGAYDGELSQVVESVDAYVVGRGFVTFAKDELCFGYRQSCFQAGKRVALAVGLQLQPGDCNAISCKMEDLTQRRTSKQPLEMPSAGSVFKRPTGFFVGTLIEEAGLKGYQVGGAQISTKHAGFIVNAGGATANDVLKLIEEVRERVHALAGVWLEPEVRVVGEESH